MKRQSILLFFSILTTFLFFSCKQKTVKTVEKDHIQKYYLSKDTTLGALTVDIEVEIPTSYVDSNVLNSIRTSIISNLFGAKFTLYSNDSIIKLYTNELVEDYKLNNTPLANRLDSNSSYSFNSELTLEGYSLLSDKKIYSYGIDRFVYSGGEHGIENRYYLNFDLKTGKVISEKDLFREGYEKLLSELIKKRIIEESKENDAEPINSLDETDYLTDSIKGNGNFYITDESIKYVFNPGEIGPYYLGETEVTLPYNRLKNILKPDSPINYIIDKQSNK